MSQSLNPVELHTNSQATASPRNSLLYVSGRPTLILTPRSSGPGSPMVEDESCLVVSDFAGGGAASETAADSQTLSPYGHNYSLDAALPRTPSSIAEHISEHTTPCFDPGYDILSFNIYGDFADGQDSIAEAGFGGTQDLDTEMNWGANSQQTEVANEKETIRTSWPMSPRPTRSPEVPALSAETTLEDNGRADGNEEAFFTLNGDLNRSTEFLSSKSPVQVKIEEFSPFSATLTESTESLNMRMVAQRPATSAGIVSTDANTPVERDEEGRWRGLSPDMRDGIRGNSVAGGGEDGFLPSLKEQELSMKLEAKNLEVEEWVNKTPLRRRYRSYSDLTALATASTPAAFGQINPYMALDMGGSDDDAESTASSFNSGSLDRYEDGIPTSPPVHPDSMNLDQLHNDSEPAGHKLGSDPDTFCREQARVEDSDEPRKVAWTSNAAMMRFNHEAKNCETASIHAVWDSSSIKNRRKSWDLEAAEISMQGLSVSKPPSGSRKPRASIFQLPEIVKERLRRSSTLVHATSADTGPSPARQSEESSISGHSRKDSWGKPALQQRNSWLLRPKSLRVDTMAALGAMAAPLAAVGGGERSPVPGVKSPSSRSPSTLAALANNLAAPVSMKRSRSKSDSVRSNSVRQSIPPTTGSAKLRKSPAQQGVIAMLKSMGGLPAPMVTRRHTVGSAATAEGEIAAATKEKDNTESDESESEDEVELNNPVISELAHAKRVISPTPKGFSDYVRELFPEINPKLVDRIAHEQMKRYKKLKDLRAKHKEDVNLRKCQNGKKCSAIADTMLQVRVQKGDSSSIINVNYPNDPKPTHHSEEGTITSLQFPRGVPCPPVSKLPAEFECPICFRIKKFNKPSDWTKHVHEDVQPFTCTWPECTEPKSFKRKADWVRHENEKHRHLEWWQCDLEDCPHKCYRKDNFVQHLAREHKKPDVKMKNQKAPAKSASGAAAILKGNVNKGKGRKKEEGAGSGGEASAEDIKNVSEIVQRCHREDDRLPSTERCRFCGATCSSWKRLTVHLARHMEAVSLPVLELIKDDANAPTSKHLSPPATSTIAATSPISPMIPQSPMVTSPSGEMSPRGTVDFDTGYGFSTMQRNQSTRSGTSISGFGGFGSLATHQFGISRDSEQQLYPSYVVNGVERSYPPNPQRQSGDGRNWGTSVHRLGVPSQNIPPRWQSNSPTPQSNTNLIAGQLPPRPHSSHGGLGTPEITHSTYRYPAQVRQQNQPLPQNTQFSNSMAYTTTSGSTTLMTVDVAGVNLSNSYDAHSNSNNNTIALAQAAQGSNAVGSLGQLERMHFDTLEQSYAALGGVSMGATELGLHSGGDATIGIGLTMGNLGMHPGIRIDADNAANISVSSFGDGEMFQQQLEGNWWGQGEPL